jgi:hypothetical protein
VLNRKLIAFNSRTNHSRDVGKHFTKSIIIRTKDLKAFKHHSVVVNNDTINYSRYPTLKETYFLEIG